MANIFYHVLDDFEKIPMYILQDRTTCMCIRVQFGNVIGGPTEFERLDALDFINTVDLHTDYIVLVNPTDEVRTLLTLLDAKPILETQEKHHKVWNKLLDTNHTFRSIGEC